MSIKALVLVALVAGTVVLGAVAVHFHGQHAASWIAAIHGKH